MRVRFIQCTARHRPTQQVSGSPYAQRFRLIAGLIAVELALSSLLRVVLIVVYRDAASALTPCPPFSPTAWRSMRWPR